MGSTHDSTTPDFWEQRYRTGRIPWDFNGVPPALVEFLSRPGEGRNVLLPGCGSGYEVKAFHDAGWRPRAIDFSPAAVQRARDVLGPLAPLVEEADFFAESAAGPYDVVYERMFLCSLPPARWAAYAARIMQVLRPGGVLAGVFYYGTDPEGPPFPLTEAEAPTLFRGFERVEDRPIPGEQSLPLFAGYERWQAWRFVSS